MSEQMNKQFEEMSCQIADIAQKTSNAYGIIYKVQKSSSEKKIELAD